MRAITFSFVDQSSSRGLEKFGENIPIIPEVIGAHTVVPGGLIVSIEKLQR